MISEEPVENYADIMMKLEGNIIYSPYDESKDEAVHYDYDSFLAMFNDNRWGVQFYSGGLAKSNIIKIENKYGKPDFYQVKVSRDNNNDGYSWGWNREIIVFEGTLEEIFYKYKPIRKNKYLENGRLYQSNII